MEKERIKEEISMVLLFIAYFILILLPLFELYSLFYCFIILFIVIIIFYILYKLIRSTIYFKMSRLLSISIKKNEKPTKIFKINDIVELRLILNKTYIYIKGKKFIQCMYLLLNITKDNIEDYNEIKNIDEASEYLDKSLERGNNGFDIVFRDNEDGTFVPLYTLDSPYQQIDHETEFMGHCSNIQVFFENGLNTDLLHSNIAFPLLKKLVDIGYKPAKFRLREEIVRRFNEGSDNVRQFLYIQGYFSYLEKEDLLCVSYDKYMQVRELKRKLKNLEQQGRYHIDLERLLE